MRTSHLLVLLLTFSVANAQFSGLISGFLEGIVEGGIKGVVGGFYPVVKDGMGVLFNLLQADIRATTEMIQQLMKLAPQLVNIIQNTINGVISTATNMFKGFTGMSRISLQGLQTTTQNGLTGLFGAFGSLNPNDQKSIANAISKTNHVILAVTKIQANSLNSADKEVPSIRQIMESEHKNPKELFAALKLKAPKLSSFLQTVFTKGSAEFAAHANKLEAPARKGLTIMQDSLRLSHKGVEHLLGRMEPSIKKEFGPVFHLMSNTIHVMNAAF